MKTIIHLWILALCALCIGCGSADTVPDRFIIIVIDRTDPMSIVPDAHQLCTQMGLKENPWQKIVVETTTISDKDVNEVHVITLKQETEWFTDEDLRKGEIKHFELQLKECLSRLSAPAQCPYSIIYRNIQRQATRLAASKAKSRWMLVYSDLAEHSSVSFYNPKVVDELQTHPEVVQKHLGIDEPLPDLRNVHIWLLYEPQSYEANQSYMVFAGFYQKVLSAKGAIVHIDANFSSQ